MLSQIEDFVNWVRRRNPQARTWRDYSYDRQQLAALVGDRSPSEVTHRDVDRFVNSQVAHGFKPATVNRRLAAILALFTYLADEDPALVCPVLPRRHFLRAPQRLAEVPAAQAAPAERPRHQQVVQDVAQRIGAFARVLPVEHEHFLPVQADVPWREVALRHHQRTVVVRQQRLAVRDGVVQRDAAALGQDPAQPLEVAAQRYGAERVAKPAGIEAGPPERA